jgi:hypothetical protein
MATIQEEWRVSKRVDGSYPTVSGFWGIGRYDDQSVLARRAKETIPGTSVQKMSQKLVSTSRLPRRRADLFFSPLTLALGTSNRQFGQ